LAWEAPAYDVSDAVPRLSVEGRNVVPDGEPWQDSIALPLQQLRAAVGFDFHGAAWVMSEKESAKDSSPAACK
jgi:hypothetical protein